MPMLSTSGSHQAMSMPESPEMSTPSSRTSRIQADLTVARRPSTRESSLQNRAAQVPMVTLTTGHSITMANRKIFEEAAIEVSKKSATIYHDEGTRKFLPNILKKAKIYRLSPEVRKELKAIGLPAVKQAWIDQVVKGGVSESDAHALLYRYIELCTKYDAESKTKTGFDVWETEFK